MEQQQGLISEKHLRSRCMLNAPEASYLVFRCVQSSLLTGTGLLTHWLSPQVTLAPEREEGFS